MSFKNINEIFLTIFSWVAAIQMFFDPNSFVHYKKIGKRMSDAFYKVTGLLMAIFIFAFLRLFSKQLSLRTNIILGLFLLAIIVFSNVKLIAQQKDNANEQ